MSRMLKTFFLLAILFAVALPQRAALACTVCLTLPETSLADRLLSAKAIVLAAPSAGNPFRYAPVRLLKGNWGDIESLPEIPFLVDSNTRNALRADPDRVVLMIYGPDSRDKAGRALNQSWTKGFLMTPRRSEFVASVQTRGRGWGQAGSRSLDRVEFFAAYLNVEDRLLRSTAMVELHRAPYEIVRNSRNTAFTPDLLQDLQSINRIAYAPATIRLLGLQSDPDATEAVRSMYPKAISSGGFNLREWALAGIEVDGAQAIAAIEEALVAGTHPGEEQRAMIGALIDGGSAIPEHRMQILGIFAQVIERDGSIAGKIALATRDWGIETLVPKFQALLSDPEIDPATAFAIRTALPADY